MRDLPALEGGSPVRPTFLPFGEPSITDAEIDEVVATLRSKWIGTGAKTARFESAFAHYVGAPHAVAVSSCTAALHLSLLAAGCGPGDEVVLPDLTFAATANAVVHTGARPVLVDVEPDTMNVSARALERAITAATRVLLPVHFGGLACDLDSIHELAAANSITVIEDCAHAVGAEYRGRKIGSGPGLSCFSFYANKNLTTGEGGMITTADAAVVERLSSWRLHGLDRDAWKRFNSQDVMISSCVYPGFKYNLTDLASSLGLHQLARTEDMLLIREHHASRLDETVGALPGVRPQARPAARADGRHGLHLYAITVAAEAFTVDRNHLVAALRAENVGAAIHYEPIHRQPYYAELLGDGDRDLPVSAHLGSTLISLPAQASMTDRDLDDVIAATLKVFEYYRA